MNIRGSFSNQWKGVSAVCLALAVLAVSEFGMAQNDLALSQHWWAPSEDETKEAGKLSELLNKSKVYVTTSFVDTRTISEPSPTRSADVHRMVLEAISVYKDLQVVPLPSQAEFAILVRTTASTESGERAPNFSLSLDPSTAVGVEAMVLVPGSKKEDGTFRPRMVWQTSVANAQVEAQSAARSTVDGFLWELARLKGKVKERAKQSSK